MSGIAYVRDVDTGCWQWNSTMGIEPWVWGPDG